MAGQTQHAHTTRRTESNGEHNLRGRSSDLLRDTIDEFKERGDDIKAVVKDYVKEKPVQALSLAVLAGAFLAFFIKR